MTNWKRQFSSAQVGILLLATCMETGYAQSMRPVVHPGIASYTVTAQELSGRLAVVGSDTMSPLLVKLASAFNRFQPNISIAVEGGGSKQAIREFLVGYTGQRRGEKARDGHDGSALPSILASSRELTADELKTFRSRYGHDPIVMPIALDAVTIFVHRDNPIQGLTLDQVDAIFSVARKRGLPENIQTWGQLGLPEKWNGQPIHLHGRDKNSGTRDFFIQSALLGGELKSEVKESSGSASEILAIANDPTAIGYAGIGYQSSYVRAVPIAEKAEMPYIKPTGEAAVDNSYPLSRLLYLYINANPTEKMDPRLTEFLRFVNSKEGQDTIVHTQYYPLTPRQVTENLALINAVAVTTGLTAR
ncbi:MAG: pstS [Nitrospira sp.]|nr:pstS [Nitrospira sp.]